MEVNLVREECERFYNNHLSSIAHSSGGFVEMKPQEELRDLGLCLRYDIVPMPSLTPDSTGGTGSKTSPKSSK